MENNFHRDIFQDLKLIDYCMLYTYDTDPGNIGVTNPVVRKRKCQIYGYLLYI